MIVDLPRGASIRVANRVILTVLDVRGDEVDLILENLPPELGGIAPAVEGRGEGNGKNCWTDCDCIPDLPLEYP